MKKGWFIFLFLLFSIHSFSQFYISGTDPSSIRWRIIKSKDFSLVYPRADSLVAKVFYNSFSRYADSMQFVMPGPKLTLPLLLHTSSSISNGVTSWAPRRIELFSRPPFDTYAQPWADQLAVHEYRHALQMNALKIGLTGTLSSIFGEVVPGAVAGLHLPTWLLEGDAVYSETLLSKAGRGRDPLFINVFRAQLHRQDGWTYNKSAFGTYNKTQANSYEFGYQMVFYTRNLSSRNIWPQAISQSGAQAWRPAALSYAIKKKTGLPLSAIFEKMADSLKALPVETPTGSNITPKLRKESSLLYVKSINASMFTAIQRIPGERDRIIIWDTTQKIKRTISVGRVDPSSLTANNGIIYWTEISQSTRWSHLSWSELWCYDTHKKSKKRLSNKSSWYNPSVSSDGSLLALVEWGQSNNSKILVFSTSDPKALRKRKKLQPLHTILFPAGQIAMKPVFMTNNSLICIVLEGNSKALYEIDLSNSHITRVSDKIKTLLDDPCAISQSECLVTTQLNDEAIIAIYNRIRKQFIPVARGSFGAAMSSITNSGEIIFGTYTPYGWQARKGSISDTIIFANKSQQVKSEVNTALNRFYQEDFRQFEKPKNHTDSIITSNYSKLSHLFKFHSWTPASISVDNEEVYPGISFFSQNLLGTMITTAGYEYKDSPGKHKFYTNISYTGLLPVLTLEVNDEIGKTSYYNKSNRRIIGDYNVLSTSLKASIPMVFENGNRITRFTSSFEAGFDHVNVYFNDPDAPEKLINNYPTIGFTLNLTRITRLSALDLQPRLGFGIYTELKICPKSKIEQYASFAIQPTLWVPGFTRHSSLRLSLGFESRTREVDNPFGLILSMPRGVADIPFRMAGHFSSTYRFQIAYPNAGSMMFLYIKRIHGALFFDQSTIRINAEDYQISSYGTELWCDYHLFRIQIPFSTGIRYSFINPDNTGLAEIMFAANFDALFFRR